MSAEMPYSLPRVAPSYGPPPYAYRRCPQLIVVFRSSAETLRALVPEPLEPNPSDLAFLMIGSMLTDEFGAYAESIVAVPSTLGARSGNHVVFHHVDAEKPMIAGREIMGWPKRLGDVRWSEDNGRIEASTTRDGRTLIRATADMVGPAGPEHLTLSPTWLNLKLIPSADGGAVPDVAQITDTTLLDVSVAEARYGTATLEFEFDRGRPGRPPRGGRGPRCGARAPELRPPRRRGGARLPDRPDGLRPRGGGRHLGVLLGAAGDSVHERAELAIEPDRVLQERQVADTVVPGGLGRAAHVQDVLGHRRQDDRVATPVGDEHRDGEPGQDVVGVDLPRRSALPGPRGARPCSEHIAVLPILRAEGTGGAGLDEPSDGGDVDRQIGCAGCGAFSRNPGPM